MSDVRSLIAGFDSQGGKGRSRMDPAVEQFIDEAMERITLGQRRSSAHQVFQAVRLEVDWAAAGSVDTDLSFLSSLELYGTEIAERRMPTRRVVEALDVIEHV